MTPHARGSGRLVGLRTALVVALGSVLVTVGWVVYRGSLTRHLTTDEVHVFQVGLLLALVALVIAFVDVRSAWVLLALELVGAVGVWLGLTATAYTVVVAVVGGLALVGLAVGHRRTALTTAGAALVTVLLSLGMVL